MRSRENVGSAEMNGAVECKTCGSKVRPISKAYDRQHSVNQPKWRALNVLLVLGDCTLIALQVRWQICFSAVIMRGKVGVSEAEIRISFINCSWNYSAELVRLVTLFF